MNDQDPWSCGMIDKATELAIMRAVGYVIRQARQAADLNLAEFADRCGVSQSVLCRVELARRPPGIEFLMTVCSQLGIRLSDLLRTAEDQAVPLPVEAREGRFRDLLGGP
jgi:transcriptional regulator with XRE-family HTH domain